MDQGIKGGPPGSTRDAGTNRRDSLPRPNRVGSLHEHERRSTIRLGRRRGAGSPRTGAERNPGSGMSAACGAQLTSHDGAEGRTVRNAERRGSAVSDRFLFVAPKRYCVRLYLRSECFDRLDSEAAPRRAKRAHQRDDDHHRPDDGKEETSVSPHQLPARGHFDRHCRHDT